MINATRISDGAPVHLHLVSEKQSPETVDIMVYLASQKFTGESDIENHAIPVLEVLEVEGKPDLHVVVTPMMRGCDDPWFGNMGEVVDFLSQVLEVGYFPSI
jgi:hypothetical protein